MFFASSFENSLVASSVPFANQTFTNCEILLMTTTACMAASLFMICCESYRVNKRVYNTLRNNNNNESDDENDDNDNNNGSEDNDNDNDDDYVPSENDEYESDDEYDESEEERDEIVYNLRSRRIYN